MIALYLKKVFSTRACRWYPDSFFQRRRPTSLTLMIVRSRALRRRNDYFGTTYSGSIVDRVRVIGCVRRETGDVAVDLIDEALSGLRVVGIPVGQSPDDDHTRSIDAEMKLLPATFAVSPMLGCRPLAFAGDG